MFKKIIISSILFSLQCCTSTQAADAHMQLTLGKIRVALITAGVSLIAASADDETKQALAEQLQPKNLANNIAYEYASFVNTLIFHELGHALCGKFLYGSPIDITLGSYNKENRFAQAGPFSIGGFDPLLGYSRYQSTEQYDKKKEAICLVAGGLLGSIAHFIFKFSIHFVTNKSNDNVMQSRLHNALNNAKKLDTIYVAQFINALFPMFLPSPGAVGSNDGEKIWNIAGVPKEATNVIGVGTLLSLVAYEYSRAHQEAISKNPKALSKLGVTLLNIGLWGYARFEA